MALEHHLNHKLRFDQQVENSQDYVLPFIEKTLTINAETKILEIGCGEGGVLKPFHLKNATCIGVDLNPIRIDLAKIFLKHELAEGKMKIMFKNILDEDFQHDYHEYFDLIILKDVIEHIHDQEKFMPFMAHLLKPNGQIFFGFPPWQMPFGGHQQIAISKSASKIPYYHLLPMGLYVWLLKQFGEPQHSIDELIDIKQTGISIERFEKIVKSSNFEIVSKQWFLINPIYKFKFGLNPRKQLWLFGLIPYLRNFFTTCAYYTIQKK